MEEVLTTALIGGFLAIVILFLFLRDIKSTAIIGLSIPISVVATFFLMFTTDVSLYIMSLGGLALGVGMLVDSSIVVLENVQRYRDAGAINDAEVEAYAAAQRIADGAPLVARWHKQFIRRIADPRPLTEAETDEGFACFGTEDFATGYRAFLAKTKPEFKGR